MGELGFNKIFGAALATFLLIFGLNELATRLFGEGGHHGEHDYESVNEWASANFHGYRIPIVETSTGADEEDVPVFDLGLMLAGADAAAGEKVLKSQCGNCHTWTEGGSNGTGPNLYAIIGTDIASKSGFNYSSALSGIDGNWTYEQMNAWLTKPQAFARGAKMNLALSSPRKDKDRVNVIAYLASLSPNAPAFPDPLPTEINDTIEATEEIVGDTTQADADTATDLNETAGDAAEDGAEGSPVRLPDDATDTAGQFTEEAQAAIDTATETAAETGNTLLEQATDAAEDLEGALEEGEDNGED